MAPLRTRQWVFDGATPFLFPGNTHTPPHTHNTEYIFPVEEDAKKMYKDLLRTEHTLVEREDLWKFCLKQAAHMRGFAIAGTGASTKSWRHKPVIIPSQENTPPEERSFYRLEPGGKAVKVEPKKEKEEEDVPPPRSWASGEAAIMPLTIVLCRESTRHPDFFEVRVKLHPNDTDSQKWLVNPVDSTAVQLALRPFEVNSKAILEKGGNVSKICEACGQRDTSKKIGICELVYDTTDVCAAGVLGPGHCVCDMLPSGISTPNHGVGVARNPLADRVVKTVFQQNPQMRSRLINLSKADARKIRYMNEASSPISDDVLLLNDLERVIRFWTNNQQHAFDWVSRLPEQTRAYDKESRTNYWKPNAYKKFLERTLYDSTGFDDVARLNAILIMVDKMITEDMVPLDQSDSEMSSDESSDESPEESSEMSAIRNVLSQWVNSKEYSRPVNSDGIDMSSHRSNKPTFFARYETLIRQDGTPKVTIFGIELNNKRRLYNDYLQEFLKGVPPVLRITGKDLRKMEDRAARACAENETHPALLVTSTATDPATKLREANAKARNAKVLNTFTTEKDRVRIATAYSETAVFERAVNMVINHSQVDVLMAEANRSNGEPLDTDGFRDWVEDHSERWFSDTLLKLDGLQAAADAKAAAREQRRIFRANRDADIQRHRDMKASAKASSDE